MYEVLGNLSQLGPVVSHELYQLARRLSEPLDRQRLSKIKFTIQEGFLKSKVDSGQKIWERSLRLYADPDSKAATEGFVAAFSVLLDDRGGAFFLLLREWLYQESLRICGSLCRGSSTSDKIA
jgi:hypothetical protein